MPFQKHHKITGNKGEKTAAAYLLQKGYVILETNFRFRRAEIDIIAQLSDCLIFVEVKTRTSAYFGLPEEAVDVKKLNKIKEAAEEYIFRQDWNGNIRFDVISITTGVNDLVCHIEDISF